jgi:Domain of unknown function (DUF4157)
MKPYLLMVFNRKFSKPHFVFVILVGVLSFASSAFGCGGIFDVQCNLEHGGLSPNNIGQQARKAGQDVANAINEFQASVLSGPTLERAIIESRNTAINGAMPIPVNIRQLLTGYASEDSMNRVRYKIGDSGFLNLAHLIEQGSGDIGAVTLIDVIVFRGTSEALDPALWAHELTHIDQFRDWGVHSFAVQYARNWRSVEDPAYAKGNGYAAWRQGMQPAATLQPLMVPQPAPGFGNYCYTLAGRFGPGPILPVGSQCFVPTPQGPLLGQVGP